MMSDNFIDRVITPETQTQNPSDMVYRKFYGMEAVASFDSNTSDNGGDE